MMRSHGAVRAADHRRCLPPPLPFFFFLFIRRPPSSTLFPYTTALPIYRRGRRLQPDADPSRIPDRAAGPLGSAERSEEHTSELQSQSNLVCRLLLEKKKKVVRPSTVDADRLRRRSVDPFAPVATVRCAP